MIDQHEQPDEQPLVIADPIEKRIIMEWRQYKQVLILNELAGNGLMDADKDKILTIII